MLRAAPILIIICFILLGLLLAGNTTDKEPTVTQEASGSGEAQSAAPGQEHGEDPPDTAAAHTASVTSRRKAAREIAASLTLEEKCAQVIMISLGGGTSVTPRFSKAYAETPAGAVLLLGENIADRAETVIDLTSSLQELAGTAGGGIPVFVAVDHEGGTVFRFDGVTTRLPGAARVGRSGASQEELFALYLNAARQLRSLGITMNLAPVLEPRTGENRDFLKYRTFSEDPAEVARHGGIMIEAMRAGGVLAVAKHFPGSGDGDPHERLPVFSSDPHRSVSVVHPFREAISRNRLAAVMTSHVIVPALDQELPATLSAKIQTEYLREEFGFRELVLTDDLNMKALTSEWRPERAAVLALKAGADMVMYLAGDFAVMHAGIVGAVRDGTLPPERIDEAVVRILELKLRADLWNRAPAVLDGSNAGMRDPAMAGKSTAAPLSAGERERRIAWLSRLRTTGDELLERLGL